MPLQWHVFLCIYQQNTFPWNQSDIVLYVNCIMFSVSSCIFLKHWLRTETHLRLPAFVWGFEWQVWKIVRTKSYSTEGGLPRSERWVAKTTTIFCITLSPLISTSKLCQFPHWYNLVLQCRDIRRLLHCEAATCAESRDMAQGWSFYNAFTVAVSMPM